MLSPDAEDAIRARRQSRQTFAYRVAQPLGYPAGQGLVACAPPGTIASLHQSGVDNQAPCLTDEPRVAFGLTLYPFANGCRTVCWLVSASNR
jgi:hypothetical protein